MKSGFEFQSGGYDQIDRIETVDLQLRSFQSAKQTVHLRRTY